ncbi:MAG TPA: ABC transporter permease [Polyangiaceae bacterium]
MGFSVLVFRYMRRSPLRAVMTVVAVAASLFAFLLLRTVGAAWTEQVEQTPNNRVVTRHKLGWAKQLPAFYAQTIRGMPGIANAVGVRWAGLKVPTAPKVYFESFAVEAREFVDMHYELSAPPEQKAAFVANRRGALVSKKLASEFHWKLGDRVHFAGMFPGDWELTVSGIFESTRYGYADRVIFFHSAHFNETLPPEEREKISLVSAQIHDPNRGALIAKAIDFHFDDKDDRSFSQEDKALNASVTGRYGAILQAVNLVSVLVLGVVLLILGNTIAMSARERTLEYATMRAIGFQPAHVAAFVLAEAALMGLAGGVLAVPLSYPLLEGGVSRYFEETMFLPPLDVRIGDVVGAVAAGGLLGLFAAGFPAYVLSRREVVRSLRLAD